MFILEEPYVSDLLLETLACNQFKVLDNVVARKYQSDYRLNLAPLSPEAIPLYSNSENAIHTVLDELKGSDTARLIALCKDKCAFRASLQKLYPDFFFQKIPVNELSSIDITAFPEQFIIKPAIGFLSMGVHKVLSQTQWEKTLADISSELNTFSRCFPEAVLSSSHFIAEEIITGEEFAIDAYYTGQGEPVILNIFQHPFMDAEDVSDRAYISSKAILEENLDDFRSLLINIGDELNIKDFPIHIEVIKQGKRIVPVEINPMRFAGWCTTDLAYYAYGINIYEYFAKGLKPDWERILNDTSDDIYYFALADVAKGLDPQTVDFDYEALRGAFSHVLALRKIDFRTKPLFAIVFGKTSDSTEITRILRLNMRDFTRPAPALHTH